MRRIAYHEAVLAERLFVEEHRWLEPGKELLVDALRRQRWRVDAQPRQEPACLRAVRRRRRNCMCVAAAVAEQQSSARTELVARRVAAKVVVVVEEQDARIVACPLAEEVRGGEPAEAAAHHDQIVRLTRVSDGAGLLPKRAVPQRVCQLP